MVCLKLDSGEKSCDLQVSPTEKKQSDAVEQEERHQPRLQLHPPPCPLTPPPPEIYRYPILHPNLPTTTSQSLPPHPLSISTSPHFLNSNPTSPPPNPNPQIPHPFLRSSLRHHPLFAHHDFAVFTWASTLDAFRHDHDSFLWMSRSLAATHRFSDLHRLLLFISSSPCPCASGIFSCPKLETLFNSAVDAFCRAGKMDYALLAFETMKRLIDGKPSVGVYNTVLNGYVKKGCDMEKALGFYKRMGKERVKLDVCTFNILINGYCKSGEFEMAFGLFKEMRERGCEPNGCGVSEATCEILVDGLCRVGLVDDASGLVMDLSGKRVLPKGFDYGV
ncbi:hypothetical protein Bca52824_009372 [Brassica carinata]|uniref:Pentatricopeptide repeat-containing protein n=1 Tax=Brassica carinata TaxID=52824 RepID=A0A8X7WBM8_BRACI|nr:hypothetical protein Bca52824_009372 [Brassica carinata]